MDRSAALDRLYDLLDQVASNVGGPRLLEECTGRDGWPTHGVYFFFEPGEVREDDTDPRVVRVGTHALTATSRTKLWDRLRTHRGRIGGRNPGGGNHRGSIFRLHLGAALIRREGRWPKAATTWGQGSSASREVRDHEVALEQEVTHYIGAMPFLWVAVPDRHDRAIIEQGCIALLSNRNRRPIDPPSVDWLGRYADRDAVRESGLWNVNHVDDVPSSDVLERLAVYIH